MSNLVRLNIKTLIFSSVFFLSVNLLGQGVVVEQLKLDTNYRILEHLEEDIPFGGIVINQDSRVDSLLRRHIGYNDSIGISGWKIMIYHGRDLKSAQDAGAKFASDFPDLDLISVVDYQAPDFKTLVGAFRTREEAYRLHQQIKTEFELSYLVHETLKPGELK